jgi:hypothetical protein
VLIILLYSNIYSYDTKIITDKNEYNGVTELNIYTRDESKEIVNKYVYYDKMNIVRKVEIELSDNVIKTKKIVKQIEYYENKKIIKYEIIHSKEYLSETGIDKTIEYMGNNDNVVKIEYYRDTKLLFYEVDNSVSRKFTLSCIKNHDSFIKNSYAESRKEFPKGDLVVIEAKTFKCKTIVTYLNKKADLDKNDKELLAGYCKSRNTPDFATLYSKKILVSENENKYWIFIQDKVLQHIENDKTMLFMYYYIGGYNESTGIMGIDFINL